MSTWIWWYSKDHAAERWDLEFGSNTKEKFQNSLKILKTHEAQPNEFQFGIASLPSVMPMEKFGRTCFWLNMGHLTWDRCSNVLQAARVGLRSSRNEKWKIKAFTLFGEVQSERSLKWKKMLSLFLEKWNVKSKYFKTEIEKWKLAKIL